MQDMQDLTPTTKLGELTLQQLAQISSAVADNSKFTFQRTARGEFELRLNESDEFAISIHPHRTCNEVWLIIDLLTSVGAAPSADDLLTFSASGYPTTPSPEVSSLSVREFDDLNSEMEARKSCSLFRKTAAAWIKAPDASLVRLRNNITVAEAWSLANALHEACCEF